ncbi:MAG: SdpI family protein [Chitinophagaceae bacterium]
MANTFLNADILAGIIFLIMGRMILRFPPKNMKNIFGYRTYLSSRNEETWKEGNRYAARFSIKLALILIPIGLFLGFVFHHQDHFFYLLSVLPVIIAALMLLGYTEWHLSITFDKFGKKKSSAMDNNNNSDSKIKNI